ncbi:MAG: hypothetical protein AAF171_24300 [Cyanobacteria bacterium P01_A01_bin.116]
MMALKEGNNFIGDELVVVITSALQTSSAGRMIFARPNRSAVASEMASV